MTPRPPSSPAARLLTLVAFAVLAFVSPALATDPTLHPLATATQATARARLLTGLAGVQSVTLFTASSSDVPVLWVKVINRPVWRIAFTPRKLSTRYYEDRYFRNFVVLLDQATGALISVEAKYSGPHPPTPYSRSAQEQGLQDGDENYTGFPTQNPGPHCTFYNVLQSSIFGAILAKEIKAYYVDYTPIDGDQPHPRWIICLNGTPLGEVIPYTTFVRFVVNAENGELISACNF